MSKRKFTEAELDEILRNRHIRPNFLDAAAVSNGGSKPTTDVRDLRARFKSDGMHLRHLALQNHYPRYLKAWLRQICNPIKAITSPGIALLTAPYPWTPPCEAVGFLQTIVWPVGKVNGRSSAAATQWPPQMQGLIPVGAENNSRLLCWSVKDDGRAGAPIATATAEVLVTAIDGGGNTMALKSLSNAETDRGRLQAMELRLEVQGAPATMTGCLVLHRPKGPWQNASAPGEFAYPVIADASSAMDDIVRIPLVSIQEAGGINFVWAPSGRKQCDFMSYRTTDGIFNPETTNNATDGIVGTGSHFPGGSTLPYSSKNSSQQACWIDFHVEGAQDIENIQVTCGVIYDYVRPQFGENRSDMRQAPPSGPETEKAHRGVAVSEKEKTVGTILAGASDPAINNQMAEHAHKAAFSGKMDTTLF